jgi:hypothetical protein
MPPGWDQNPPLAAFLPAIHRYHVLSERHLPTRLAIFDVREFSLPR